MDSSTKREAKKIRTYTSNAYRADFLLLLLLLAKLCYSSYFAARQMTTTIATATGDSHKRTNFSTDCYQKRRNIDGVTDGWALWLDLLFFFCRRFFLPRVPVSLCSFAFIAIYNTTFLFALQVFFFERFGALDFKLSFSFVRINNKNAILKFCHNNKLCSLRSVHCCCSLLMNFDSIRIAMLGCVCICIDGTQNENNFFLFASTTSEHANNKNDSVQFRHTQSEREREVDFEREGGGETQHHQHYYWVCLRILNVLISMRLPSSIHHICGTIMRRERTKEKQIEQKREAKRDARAIEWIHKLVHTDTHSRRSNETPKRIIVVVIFTPMWCFNRRHRYQKNLFFFCFCLSMKFQPLWLDTIPFCWSFIAQCRMHCLFANAE